MAIAWWSIGNDALIHSSTCIMVTWATLKIFQGSLPSTIFMYIFHMGYLGAGYYFKQTTGYDINWTMPGCVLCLRLIGLSVDVHDGTKPELELSKDQKENALKEVPSILEMFSHAFFIGGYFVGPQFSMKKYQNFIQRNIEEDLPPSRRFAFKRFGIGVLYMAGHLIGDKFVSLKQEFCKKILIYFNTIFYFLTDCTRGFCRNCRISKLGILPEELVLFRLGQDYLGQVHFCLVIR